MFSSLIAMEIHFLTVAARFHSVSQVYRTVAEDTELGKEKPDQRVRGQTVEDVVELISRGLQAKKDERKADVGVGV